MKTRKKIILCTALLLSLLFTGCFNKTFNNAKRDGGFFKWSQNAGDYIIINTYGNKILDVYKLKDKFVQNQENSDGIGFVDNDGNYVILSGDVKVIRIYNKKTWNKYKEYHWTNNTVTN